MNDFQAKKQEILERHGDYLRKDESKWENSLLPGEASKALDELYLSELLKRLEGLEVDLEATRKHIESVGGSDNDLLNAEINADDRHEVLNDVREALKELLS